MKAAIITAPGASPVYGDFPAPTPQPGCELITVQASALSHLSKMRSSGQHYSSDNVFPAVPGVDGVGLTADGRRVYFALPEAPFGPLAEISLADARRCIPVPDSLNSITAAALANPGMSAWTALIERARLQPGETVLIHGGTSTAGRLAIQIARHIGAAKIIVTARNITELSALGADVAIPLDKNFDEAIEQHLAGGVHVVVDYLWGKTARSILVAIARTAQDETPVRFVHVGAAAGEPELSLPGDVLRSSALLLMGSGLKSVSMPVLLNSITQVYGIAQSANLQIATQTAPLSEIASTWEHASFHPRLVYIP